MEPSGLFSFGKITGKISRDKTALIVFASDEVIESVAANIEANTRPTRPAGKKVVVNPAYIFVGSPKSGNNIGAAHMGKNKIRGHRRKREAESRAAFFASFPEGVAINLAAKFQVPPL